MALVNCKQCNKEISSLAISCPHCGADTENKKLPGTNTDLKNEILNMINDDKKSIGSWHALFSCVCGILGIFWAWPIVFSVLAVIHGLFAMKYKAALLGFIGFMLGGVGVLMMSKNIHTMQSAFDMLTK